MTWGELNSAVGIHDEDYEKFIKKSNFVLIGFPIPKRIGQMLCQIHWQALCLPELSNIDNQTYDQKKLRLQLLRNIDIINSTVDWQKSENWLCPASTIISLQRQLFLPFSYNSSPMN